MIKTQGDQKIIIAEKSKKDKLRIFCDMDGVLSFWEKSAAKTLDIDLNDEKIREELKQGKKKMEDYVGGDDKLWRKIDKEGIDWWTNMEILPWGKRLFDELNKATTEFSILSSPSNNPVCADGKIRWMRKQFGEDFKNFLIGRNKYLCAGPNTLLVDDNKGKCKKFRQYGGNTFVWPSPFKLIDGDIDVDETIEELLELIDGLKK